VKGLSGSKAWLIAALVIALWIAAIVFAGELIPSTDTSIR
jgi:hypothetical protein